MSCDCRFCKEHQRFKDVVAGRDVEQLILLATDLFEQAQHAEHDNEYYRCILNGSWPSAREILERALSKVPQPTEL
jgi:hypothetical protein